MGDGADKLRALSSIGIPVTADGGDGDDQLNVASGANQITGGDGDDWLFADASGPAAGDVYSGGPGHDSVFYTYRFTPQTITIDDIANDGNPGEGDDVRSDVEEVRGGVGNDTITGGPNADVLFGGEGVDTLNGLAGDDTLDGWLGCDADTLLGGAGDDTLILNGRAQADGGPDNDTLRGGIQRCGGTDVHGGDGRDLADLREFAEEDEVFSLDDVANDGLGGSENYHSDIEDMSASAYTLIPRTGDAPTCGIYPQYAYPCPIVDAQAVHYRAGEIINNNGAVMPHNGYVYQYEISRAQGFFRELATCSNLLGLPTTAPDQFSGRVAGNSNALCSDLVTSAPTTIAVGDDDIYPLSPFSHDPPPDTPYLGAVQTATDPGWTVPSVAASAAGVRAALADKEELKKYLAWEADRRCNPNPTVDTVTVPTIQAGESGQHYANCLKSLGLDPSVRAKSIGDADTSKGPGAALSGTAPGTELGPGDAVTVVTNPGPTGGGADAVWLRDIEAGLVAHNPELVDSIPNFETEVVPVVALQCAKNVKNAEAFAAQEGIDSTASEEDCGDEEQAGLPMYVSGSTTPQATQNDLNGLARNPLWTVLHRRLVPVEGNTMYPPSWWFSKKDRYWYNNQPGCADKAGFALPSCDEFPYFATLQGQFGLLKTETPHVETVERPQNLLQGSLLSKFYGSGGNGNTGYTWHGCNVTGQPRTEVVVTADRFMALPNKILPTYGICNATP